MLYSANKMMMMIILTTTTTNNNIFHYLLSVTVFQALCSVVGDSRKLTVTLGLLEFS